MPKGVPGSRSTVTLICRTCGQAYEVERRKADTSKFCSRPCQHAGTTTRNDRCCPICGKTFRPSRESQKTCSEACRRANPRQKSGTVRSDAGTRRAAWVTVPCHGCGIPVERRRSDVRKFVFHDLACAQAHPIKGRGRRPSPIGTRRQDSEGYIRVYTGNGPYRGWAMEHRLVVEQVLGRSIESGETPHHKNGDRGDNRPENLELWMTSQPKGQRVADLVAYAREILDRYAAEVEAHPDIMGAT